MATTPWSYTDLDAPTFPAGRRTRPLARERDLRRFAVPTRSGELDFGIYLRAREFVSDIVNKFGA